MNLKKITALLILSLLTTPILSAQTIHLPSSQNLSSSIDDYDPLIDLNLTITIQTIRALDAIDYLSEPDFYIKATINQETYTSPIWKDITTLQTPWSVTIDIPDNIPTVNITLELWDWNPITHTHCDIGPTENTQTNGKNIDITYDIRTGRWFGDDNIIGDKSGYGRANGCDDTSIYTNEHDCELFFDITQNDYDNDSLPYWTETTIYHTDPETNNANTDYDNDKIPTKWEHRWNYNPFIWDNHNKLDPDYDSLTNLEEYNVSHWNSDPYRPDLFLELDFMEDGPNGEKSIMPHTVSEMLLPPMHKHNIVYHIDTGQENGGELIPWDNLTETSEINGIYDTYFIKNESNQWRRGIFHYGFFVYLCKPNGFAFSGDGPFAWGYGKGTNAFIIASKNMYRLADKTKKPVDNIYAASIMHEMGHNFGIRFSQPFGCDNRNTRNPFRLSFWLFRTYKSIMNYRYTYYIFDYSDGTHGRGDYDDWNAIDLTWFEPKKSDEGTIMKSFQNHQ
jgi:hypothetical protein